MAATSAVPDIQTLLLGPGLEPPPGVLPNFVNPYSHKDYVILTIIVSLSVSILLVATRVYTRSLIAKSIGLEDWTCLLAFFLLVSYCTIGAATIQYGGGVHQWNVRFRDVVKFARLASAATTVYSVSILVTKLAILVQYLRIFVPSRNKVFYLTHFIIWFNVLFYIAVALVTIFQCTPREKIWQPFLPGKCVNFNAILIAGAAINVASDFAILALPIGSVWRLQMALRNKVGISAIFAVGLFACVASIMRLVASVHMTHSKDLTYYLIEVYLWTYASMHHPPNQGKITLNIVPHSVAEIASGILCCCLPILPQFFRHFVPKITSSFKSSHRRKSSPSFPSENSKQYPPGAPIRAGAPWQGSHANRPKGPYVELNDVGGRQGPKLQEDDGYEPRTRIFGGVRGSDGAVEGGVLCHGGIHKTTTVEQHHY